MGQALYIAVRKVESNISIYQVVDNAASDGWIDVQRAVLADR